MQEIMHQTFDQERALYHLQNALVQDCVFAGPADGESALKESDNVTVDRCRFSLRYPFWHARGFCLKNSTLDELTRAPIWYAQNSRIEHTKIQGVKCLRECDQMTLSHVTAVSPEFGWRCRDLTLENCDITGEYFLFECRRVQISGLHLQGKYSFQYTDDLEIADSLLDTKDAFWHAKNVTVKNCTVKGEYLGWYSDGLTLINCHISGTQPLCYCKNLTLINCTMENTDLSFEYSDVQADICGHILSVKNPRSGRIQAASIGEIVLEDSVMESTCQILTSSGN